MLHRAVIGSAKKVFGIASRQKERGQGDFQRKYLRWDNLVDEEHRQEYCKGRHTTTRKCGPITT